MDPAPELVARFRADLAAVAPQAGGLAVAVSGGADSLALLLLAAGACPGRVAAATVDHGLRAESAAEAASVAALCRGLDIPHSTLAVEVAAAGLGVQAAAREARYAALAGWMRTLGADTLLTGHHLDDQAETLLMRLLRGSGVAGLAGIRSASPFPAAGPSARLARPLLGWRRAELEAIVRDSGLAPAADPSNTDEAYDRARLRRLIGEAGWLDPVPLARSAAALAEAEEALRAAAGRLYAERARERDGIVRLDPAEVPRELLRRLVLAALRRVAADAEPRGEQLTALIDRLSTGEIATLAGVKAVGGAVWTFEPAPPRRGYGV
jgi:tRNA(Ile)-lysidine synthase